MTFSLNAYEKIYGKIYYFFSTNKRKLYNGKVITCTIKLIDSFRFMPSKLSDLVHALSEIYKKECKGCKERKKIKSVYDFIELKNNRFVTNPKNVKKHG